MDSDLSEKIYKFVIFSVDEKLYALPSENVKEIVLGYTIHYLPFVPGYIRGLLNRHGDPYTVVDLKLLFDQQNLDAEKFIIIRNDSDNLALIISEISKIVNLSKGDINIINHEKNSSDYFNNSITLEDNEVPILEIESIIKKIADDIR